MRITKTIQFFLLALIAVGVFASMARNSYGFTFIGVGCFGLGLLYVLELIWKLIEDRASLGKDERMSVAELLLLAVLLALFGFRAFYIYVPGVEFIFMGVCVLLIVVYLLMAGGIFTSTKRESRALAWNMVLFYSSILFFLLSMLTRVLTLWSLLFGVLGMLSSLPFLFSVLRQQKYEVSGKHISLFQFVLTSKSKAGILFLFFIFSGLYTGLSQVGFIPEIENSDRPKAYIDLINDAESGKDIPVDGKYHHETYSEAMNKFLERHEEKKR